ncbi:MULTISPECIES: hypothetical protein [unclassified Streptomyces]|uniref:hypothetical protein n=1 Tax=unclassified Streptomyces TaxID=2593676 RepID=UPI0033F7DC95
MTARRITYLSVPAVLAAVWIVRRILATRRPETSDQLVSRPARLAPDTGSPKGVGMDEPITASLPPYVWDSEQAVAYEAAVEAINGTVGAYSALIAREEQRDTSERDESALAEWRSQRAACQRARQELHADDAAQIRSVRTQYAARLAELRDVIG